VAALEDVLDRIRTDDAYRAAVARDPTVCLREFALGPDEMAVVEEAAARGDG
jgi:hypothetical protein